MDYCLASEDFVIRGAALRNFVHVFGLTLVKGTQQLFVARPAPAGKAAKATTMCVMAQVHGAPPPAHEDLVLSTPLDVAKKQISGFARIDQTVQLPVMRSSRPLAPSVRHALFFCLQEQNEVANPTLLFHGQAEDLHRSALRAMLPYFLGAVDPERALREHRLRLLRRQLAEMGSALAASDSVRPASGLTRPPRKGKPMFLLSQKIKDRPEPRPKSMGSDRSSPWCRSSTPRAVVSQCCVPRASMPVTVVMPYSPGQG